MDFLQKEDIEWKEIPENIRTAVLDQIKVKYIILCIIQTILSICGFIFANKAYLFFANPARHNTKMLMFAAIFFCSLLVAPFAYTIPRKLIVLISLAKNTARYTTLDDMKMTIVYPAAKAHTITIKHLFKHKIFSANQNGKKITNPNQVMLVKPFPWSTSLFAIDREASVPSEKSEKNSKEL